MYYIEKNDELYHVVKDRHELYHHGVKGQKWGVIRFRKHGTTKAEIPEKKAKKWFRKNSAKFIDREYLLCEEYDKTPDGLSKLKRYKKELEYRDKAKKDWDKNKKAQSNFHDAQKSYFTSRLDYSARKMLSEYGNEQMTMYAYGTSERKIHDDEDIIKEIKSHWVWDV